MSSIRSRLIIICALSISVIVVFGFLTFSTFQTYSQIQSERALSFEIVYTIVEHQKKNLSPDDIQAWTQKTSHLTPEFRFKNLQAAFKTPSNSHLQAVIKTEQQFQVQAQQLLSYFQSRIFYFGSLTLFASLLLCFSVMYFVLRQVFSPMSHLSRRMAEFLDNKYSYEFSVPANHEVGRLHSSFNTMAQKVLQQIEDLKALDKAKTEFLSIASHELRTPLTSIKGSLALLNSGVAGAVSDTAKNLMTIALNETDRLIRIINELLDLAKIEARQFPLNCQWLSAQELITKTFSSLTGFCKDADVSLKFEGTEPVEVLADQDRLQQVLTNLLSNAVKFSPKGSTVTVRMFTAEDNAVHIEVRDQGRGIAPEDQELIFEKFRQATSAQNPLVKGTGLGLTIAKALVEQHGGKIGVRSTPGQGATFYFTLPQWRPYTPAQPNNAGAA